jgi:RNA polymerase sigma-70 factor (ECF subfamily)
MEGYELTDIARMLRIPTGTVKTRLLRARKLLRELLEEEV